MFHFIEPQEHHLYQSSIDPFLSELHVLTELKKEKDLGQALNQARFLLVKREIKGIKGGVLLIKKRISMLDPEVAEYLCTFSPHLNEVWTGMVSFQMHEEIAGRDFEKVCKTLYCTLHKDLTVFSIKEKTPYLCLTMPRIEYLTINLLGLWPYVFEARPDGSSNDLFQGILALTGAKQAANPSCSKSDFQTLVAQNCNKIVTVQEKNEDIFFPLMQ